MVLLCSVLFAHKEKEMTGKCYNTKCNVVAAQNMTKKSHLQASFSVKPVAGLFDFLYYIYTLCILYFKGSY